MSTYYIIDCARLAWPEGKTTCTERPIIRDALLPRRWESTYYADALDKAQDRVNEIMAGDDAAVFVLLSKWDHPEEVELITGRQGVRANPQATETPVVYADRAHSIGISTPYDVVVHMEPWVIADTTGQTPVTGGHVLWTPREIRYNPATGAPLAENRVDWTSVDWSLGDSQIARIVGVTRQAVAAARKRHGE